MKETARTPSERVVSLLERRGIVGNDVHTFLSPDFERDTHDPHLLHDIERAVQRIFLALDAKEKVAVYADFDCDGIPGAVVLHDFFKAVGHSELEVYIPHRDREGYGLHVSALQELASRGVSLIITVDVGTTAIEPIAYAKELGMDVIVTDHHEIVGELPAAYALLNPKLGAYPFRDLCGAAVAWKLVVALLHEGRKRGLPAYEALPLGWEKWLLDMVGIATIADLVPLVGENRVLAHFGLRVLRKSRRPGIRALAAHLRLSQNTLSEDDIGFSLAPRINAASRMGEPELAFRLLATTQSAEAENLVHHLEDLNAKRKTTVAVIVREAKKRARARFTEGGIAVLGDVAWRPPLLGLAANSVMEERGGVVCLWGRDAAGRLKGSCRSDGSLSIVDLFSEAKDALLEYGGHAFSGGFSVSHEAVHTLPEALEKAAGNLSVKATEEKAPELELSLYEISDALLRELSLLAPFGMGNPKPLIRISGSAVGKVRQFGKERNHIEVTLSCTTTGVTCRGFDFFRSESSFSVRPESGRRVSVFATLEKDSFRGEGAIALRLVDMKPASF